MAHKYPLTRGHVTVVDASDFSRIVEFGKRWFASPRRHTVYAARDGKKDGKWMRIYLHRWILDVPDDRVVDHINGDGLDNRRANLRIVTTSENSLNRLHRAGGASGFIGVATIPESGNWRAYVNVANRQIAIGVWPTAMLAASARDLYVAEHHGTAPFNFPGGPPHKSGEIAATKIEKPRSDHPNIRLHAGAWELWVRIDGRRVYTGRFRSLEEAQAAQRAEAP